MNRTARRTLILIALAAAPAIPLTVSAQAGSGGTARAASEAAPDPLTAQDRELLAAAELLASESSQVLEQWIITQATTEDRLFARLYFPIPKTHPQKYTTTYDSLADRDLVGPEDKALAHGPSVQYAIVTDLNGYIPAHNTRFAQPLTGDPAQDYVNNRTKRIAGDPASLTAARSEARYLLQRTKLETGDVIYDLSVPIMVRGKHWGCARIGYRRAE